MSPTLRWSLLVAGEAALVLFLLTWGLTFTGSVPLHQIQLVILATLGGVGWLAILMRPSRLPVLLVVAPLPLLASLAITSFWSAYPSLSWFATWQCAAYVGIAWLLAMQASNRDGRRNLIAAMGIVVTVVIAVYAVQVASAWSEWLAFGFPISSLPLRPLYSGGIAHIPAWLADVVVLCVPVVVVSLWVRRARILAAALAVAGALVILVSGTRSVLLLIVVVSALGAVFVVVGRGSRRTRIVSAAALVGVVGVGIAIVASASRGFDLGRSSSYASAIARFLAAPMMGTGPGTYGVGRMTDPVDALSNLAQPDASNVLLTIASESGLIGLIGLGMAVVAYGVAVRSAWVSERDGRPVRIGALLSVVVVAGHAMGEVVFALIGVVLLSIAALSIAATTEASVWHPTRHRLRFTRIVVVSGLAVFLLSTTVIIRNELTLDAVSRADAALRTSPDAALTAARDGTTASPDSAPAWWMRMVAADAVGDDADAIASGRRAVELEGFGQQWLSLSVLLARSGDAGGARDAMDRAVDTTVHDPVVQLNAAIYYDAIGATEEARRATKRLLLAQPDIEPLVIDNLPTLAPVIASVRADAAAASRDAGDPDKAFLIALSGEDRDLADRITQEIDAARPGAGDVWRTITAAWFGDEEARARQDRLAQEHPAHSWLSWSWRLAVRACDAAAATRWERAIEIVANYHPTMPTAMGQTPDFQVRMFPPRYPGVVWRMDLPQQPYPAGIRTYSSGRAPCSP